MRVVWKAGGVRGQRRETTLKGYHSMIINMVKGIRVLIVKQAEKELQTADMKHCTGISRRNNYIIIKGRVFVLVCDVLH